MKNEFDPKCHVGETHGVYTIVSVSEDKDKYGHYIYKGVCKECGREKFAHYGGFSGSKHVATICNHLNVNGEYFSEMSWSNKRLGRIFHHMKNRCYNQTNKAYCWYGAKGIKICDEWINNPKAFEDWALSNGYSDELTIDRMDESKDYCPENCRWITLESNAKYKSTTSLIEVDGDVHTGREWANILGLGVNTINKYIKRYGLENTIEFIRLYLSNPTLKPKRKQSYYDLYMS